MSIKVVTLLKKIDTLNNKENAAIIIDFYNYMREKGSSENHIMNCLKVVIDYANHLREINFIDIDKKENIVSFLNLKIKPESLDPDKRWITTWNHYLNRLKLFFRWLHNRHTRSPFSSYTENSNKEWITPDFIKIKQKQTKRTSPYSGNEIWERDELMTILKYEPIPRNKAIISLMWDLDARPHEITLLKIKNIRFKENYGEGEIPYQAKTGSGPILLTMSFPYVRDWMNVHPFKNEPEARLICNLHTGSPITPKSLWNLMEQLKNRIIRLMENGEIADGKEKLRLDYLLKTKKWNPYCIRHSSITADSDYLTEYALKKKVRWSMNSKQGTRYIKNRYGNDLKNRILEQNGIKSQEYQAPKSVNINCPRCELVNANGNKYCSACSYPLLQDALEEIKRAEEERLLALEEKYAQKFSSLEQTLEKKIKLLFSKLKPELLTLDN